MPARMQESATLLLAKFTVSTTSKSYSILTRMMRNCGGHDCKLQEYILKGKYLRVECFGAGKTSPVLRQEGLMMKGPGPPWAKENCPALLKCDVALAPQKSLLIYELGFMQTAIRPVTIPMLALISLAQAIPKSGIVGDALSGQDFGGNHGDFYGRLPYDMLVEQYGLSPRDLEYFGHMGIYPLSTGGCSCPRPLIPQIMGDFSGQYPNKRPHGNNYHHSNGGKHQHQHQMGGYNSDDHHMDNFDHHMGDHLDEHHLGDIFDDHHMGDHLNDHHMGEHYGNSGDQHHGGYGNGHKDMQMGDLPYLSGRGNFEEDPKVGDAKKEPVVPMLQRPSNVGQVLSKPISGRKRKGFRVRKKGKIGALCAHGVLSGRRDAGIRVAETLIPDCDALAFSFLSIPLPRESRPNFRSVTEISKPYPKTYRRDCTDLFLHQKTAVCPIIGQKLIRPLEEASKGST
ncbi:unnamed protein product [Phyllotreta striolata]|uniref:Uncharacterized protein n=1 Tax=Phyllotreta striolata TaxID=444603 RepID=A0A9N9TI18_PHYSR|nr:unnamed protein product [Phyllotreta striolata]